MVAESRFVETEVAVCTRYAAIVAQGIRGVESGEGVRLFECLVGDLSGKVSCRSEKFREGDADRV